MAEPTKVRLSPNEAETARKLAEEIGVDPLFIYENMARAKIGGHAIDLGDFYARSRANDPQQKLTQA